MRDDENTPAPQKPRDQRWIDCHLGGRVLVVPGGRARFKDSPDIEVLVNAVQICAGGADSAQVLVTWLHGGDRKEAWVRVHELVRADRGASYLAAGF